MKKLFLIIILAIASAPGVRAQEPQVEFALDPIDVSARTMQRLDLHGEKCALVKVRVLGSDVSFRGSVMGDVKKDGSEYWVYMPGNTKMLQISSETFLPFRYNFPEPLRGGSTYVLTIHTPQAAQPQRRKENFLVLKVSPANAHVYVDGTERPVEDGIVSVPLADGPHTYRAEAIGYAPVSGSVTMAGERVARTVALVSNKPTLTVTAAADATEIYVNDVRRGAGSWNGELVPGDYIVEGRLTGHRTNTQKVTLAEGQNRTVTIPALEAITGSLSVTYKPVDATITIDGRASGVSPNVFNDLAVGAHTVTIAAPGYTPATHTITISESAPSTLTGSLAPAPTAPASTPTATDIALTDEYEPFRDESTGMWGFKHNGRIVIPAKYDNDGLPDYFRKFSEGLAGVLVEGKVGFIDKTGSLVIPAKYNGLGYFHEGLVGVMTNGKWGYIDKMDNIVIPAKYEDSRLFCEGLAGVKINGMWGFIDKMDNLVIPAKYSKVGDFHEGLAWAGNFYKWGFIDKAGTMVIPAKYDEARYFENGKAKVKLNGREFYIDRNGNEVDSNAPAAPTSSAAHDEDPYAADIALTSEYESFKDPSSGKYGFKHDDSVVIPAKYDDAGDFSEGLALVKINGKYGFIDKTGSLVIPAIFGDATKFHEGIAGVTVHDSVGGLIINRKLGIIDKTGTLTIIDECVVLHNFHNGRAMVQLSNDKYGFIDKTGALVIPAIYDDAFDFSDGLAYVKTNGKYGFVDKNGTFVIPAKYDYVYEFSGGLANVRIKGKWGLIDTDGSLVIPTKYNYDDFGKVSEGLAGLKIKGKWGYFDKTGAMVIPAIYEWVTPFENGKAKVKLNGREFYIDRNGNEVQ